MNNLILEILPDIKETAKKISRVADQQNELTQFAIIQSYRYDELVTRLYAEGNLNRWLYRIIKNEYLAQVKNRTLNVEIDPYDRAEATQDNEVYFVLPVKTFEVEEAKREHKKKQEVKFEDFLPYLSDVERAWIRLYIEAEGNYREMERLKDIHHTTCSSRMKLIIEKCRILKSTLF